ncbi:MAG: hypothetical protein RL392_2186 [Pseudomonadota bacterium]|jgi:hypothetical protein
MASTDQHAGSIKVHTGGIAPPGAVILSGGIYLNPPGYQNNNDTRKMKKPAIF